MYLKFAKKVDFKHSHHTHIHKINYMSGGTCVNLIVVIISQCTHITNHRITHFQNIQFDGQFTPVKLGGGM